jgi:hypothetical protein
MGIAPWVEVYLLAWAVVGIGMGAGLYDATFATLGRLYGTDERRAITAVTLWGGFASTLCWPLSAFLVESLGWRETCLVYAGLHLCLALPLNLFAVPREVRRVAAAMPAAAGARAALAPGRAVFVLLALVVTVAAVIATVISVHLIVILQAGGMTLAAAVGLGALIGPSQVGARMLEALIGARLHPIWSLVAAAVLIAAGVVLLRFGPGLAAAALIGYAAGNGILSIARGAVPLSLFGAEGYATLMGRLATPALIAQAIAPSAGALLMEHAGAQATLEALALLALANLGAVALLWRVSGVRR